jgi:hypothetical protein
MEDLSTFSSSFASLFFLGSTWTGFEGTVYFLFLSPIKAAGWASTCYCSKLAATLLEEFLILSFNMLEIGSLLQPTTVPLPH